MPADEIDSCAEDDLDESQLDADDNVIPNSDDEDGGDDAIGGAADDAAVDEEDNENESVAEEDPGADESDVESGGASKYRLAFRGKRYPVPRDAIVRDHKRIIWLKSGENLSTLRHSNSKSNWPDVDPAEIVVLKAKAEAATPEDEDARVYFWYCRAAVRGSTEDEKRADASTLIQIPRAVVSATVQKMSMDPALSDSKLLRRYMPHEGNSRTLQPVAPVNDWPSPDPAKVSTAEKRDKKRKPEVAEGASSTSTKKAKAALEDPKPIQKRPTKTQQRKKPPPPAEANGDHNGSSLLESSAVPSASPETSPVPSPAPAAPAAPAARLASKPSTTQSKLSLIPRKPAPPPAPSGPAPAVPVASSVEEEILNITVEGIEPTESVRKIGGRTTDLARIAHIALPSNCEFTIEVRACTRVTN